MNYEGKNLRVVLAGMMDARNIEIIKLKLGNKTQLKNK